ncbi:MAG: hypothetical protein EXS10_01380 [Phycisphaerales bacterium]|nr:hypothetical protein [Phycisphaerales bacterium]
MRKTTLTLTVIALGCFGASIATAPPSLKFTSMGFSIAPLTAPADATNYIPLLMTLPAGEDGFTPHVNVLVQPWETTLEEYKENSLRQLKDSGFTVIAEGFTANAEGGTDDAKAFVMEYEGDLGEGMLHYYAKARARRGNIILATATASSATWKDYALALKTSVDSLTVDGAKKPADAPNAAKPATP